MNVLIKQARIIDPDRPLHLAVRDILIQQGQIAEISETIDSPADKIIEIPGLHVSPGFVETFADAADPGTEFRETMETAAMAAASGGFTHLFLVPNTKPVRHDRSMVATVADRNIQSPVRLHPIGALTKDNEGKELAEMYDMKDAGAIAFSDGLHPIRTAGILVKAFQYVKTFGGVIIQLPDDGSLAPHGLMHEGVMSARLGLPGRPAIAEELTLTRDIRLCGYTGSRLHVTGITLPASVQAISSAKAEGIDVTSAVTPYHLMFCDEDLSDYDTNLKVTPPLRTRKDRDALLQAVKQGSIDVISSHHLPQHIDHKQCEFEYAKPGMIGLETCFGSLQSLGLEAELIVRMLSKNPRRIFGLPDDGILPGSMADLALFLPESKYILHGDMIQSRSKNSPMIGKELKGKVAGVIYGEKLRLFDC